MTIEEFPDPAPLSLIHASFSMEFAGKQTVAIINALAV
jgi:hypothetical protein